MKHKKHYKQQLNHFEREFAKKAHYTLHAWEESYIKRIGRYALTKNYRKKTLLDIAAGSGYVSVEMAKKGMNVIATDLSPTAVKNIKSYKKVLKLKKLRAIKCYAEHIPLEDKSIDFIVANAILEHIPDEKNTIQEWKRLLKKEGYIYITVPMKYRYLWPFFWPINYIHDKRVGHLRRYDKDEIEQKFGMKMVDYYYTGHIIKMFFVLFSIFFNLSKYDHRVETIDNLNTKKRYGASNISVLLKNC